MQCMDVFTSCVYSVYFSWIVDSVSILLFSYLRTLCNVDRNVKLWQYVACPYECIYKHFKILFTNATLPFIYYPLYTTMVISYAKEVMKNTGFILCSCVLPVMNIL